MRTIVFAILAVLGLAGCTQQGGGDGVKAVAPLPSWQEGKVRTAILNFVKTVTDSGSAGYVPVADRIATFDNDGTLWAEKPYVQEVFAIWKATKMIEADPHLRQVEPFKAVAEDDKGYFAGEGQKAALQLVVDTHTGMSEDAFERSVAEFFAQATVKGKPIRQLVYQPQLELLDYLRSNGFKIFICTGGTVEVVRGISQSLYGIPKEQVIGTNFKYRFIDSTGSLTRDPAIDHFNDKEAKPAAIQLHIGSRPILACGNEGGEGDIAMLKFCSGNRYPSLQLLVNHDDSVREYYYQEKGNASLHAAIDGHWQVISIHNDWKQVFPEK